MWGRQSTIGSMMTKFVYDKNRRAIETRAQTGNTAQPEQVTTTVYTASDKEVYAQWAAGPLRINLAMFKCPSARAEATCALAIW